MRNVTSVALITGIVLLTGCGSASSTPGRTGGPVPGDTPAGGATTGQDRERLLLRGQISGGIGGRGGPGALPDFSLYADGSAIMAKGGFGHPDPMTEFRLTPAAVQRLIDSAYAAGLNRSRTVDRANVADATYLSLRFTVGGRTASTRIIQVETENDPAERFWNERIHPEGADIGFPKTDLARDPAPYRPARLAVLASESDQSTGTRPGEWPLTPLNRGVRVGGWLCTLLTGPDVARATKLLAPAAPGTRWRSDSRTYLLQPRPLLPDESNCGALNSP
jgi:hypothetical protein